VSLFRLFFVLKADWSDFCGCAFVLKSAGCRPGSHPALSPAEAIPIAAEGCQILLPFARQYPAALGELLRALASIYIDSCKASSQPPDPTLLQKLTPFLNPTPS
jgi:hypothetical protein